MTCRLDLDEKIPQSFRMEGTGTVVFLLWHLGDVLVSTALLPRLREIYPRPLVYATSVECAELLEHNPSIDLVVAMGRYHPAVTTAREISVQEEIYGRVVRHLNPSRSFNLHLAGTRPRWRSVATFLRLLEQSSLLFGMAKMVGLEQLPDGLKPYISDHIPSEIVQKWDRLLPEQFLVVSTGGNWDLKRWPIEKWRRLIQRIKQAHPSLFITQLGSRTDPIIPGIDLDLRERTSLIEAGYIISRSQLCISHDSFIAQLAGALGIPTFVLFGPTHPHVCMPLGPQVFSLRKSFPCCPCSRRHCLLTGRSIGCLLFPSEKKVFEAVAGHLKC